MGGHDDTDEQYGQDQFLHWTNVTVNKFSADLLPRREVTLEPLRQTVEAGEKDALGNVGLIELVADLPLQRGRDDDAAIGRFAAMEKVFERQLRARGEGEERELIDDALVE